MCIDMWCSCLQACVLTCVRACVQACAQACVPMPVLGDRARRSHVAAPVRSGVVVVNAAAGCSLRGVAARAWLQLTSHMSLQPSCRKASVVSGVAIRASRFGPSRSTASSLPCRRGCSRRCGRRFAVCCLRFVVGIRRESAWLPVVFAVVGNRSHCIYLRRLYLGIADGVSIARVWACRYSK